MPLCKFQPGYAMFCATPVENLFIEEYLPQAPADYVKVYLYGLMHCYYPDGAAADLSMISRGLNMEQDRVREAFFYWQQQRLVSIQFMAGQTNVYYNVLPRDTNGFAGPDVDRFADFNRQMQQMFNPRQFTPRETDDMHDWIEGLGFPVESALLIGEYAIRMHGKDVSISYMNTVAENWAQEGLIAPEAIRAHLEERRSDVRDVSAILAALGIRKRGVSEAELSLYHKWTDDWGFERDAVELACMQSASAQQPTMQYVDSILASFRQNGIFTRGEIEDFLHRREEKKSAALTVQTALGVNGGASPTLMQAMDTWRDKFGYDSSVVVLAARTAARRNQKSLDALENILAGWNRAGLATAEDIRLLQQRESRLNEDLSIILERLHVTTPPDDAGRSSLTLWTEDWGIPFEVVLFGADCVAQTGEAAYGRMRSLSRLMETWHRRGVRSVPEAQNAWFSSRSGDAFQRGDTMGRSDFGGAPYGASPNPALNYTQRNDSLEDLYVDL